MPALALFDVLQDFGKRPHRASEPGSANESRQPAAPAGFAPSPPPPDISEIIRTEVARAEAALEARLSLAHEAALEAQRLEHAAEIDELNRQFGDQAGQMITARIAEMESRVSELATSATARILGGVVSEEMQKRSLDSLAKSIREAIDDADAVRIQVRGPQSLFETLRLSLADRADKLDYMEAPGFDLTVTIDGNLFETRLSEWSAAILEILS